MTDRRPMTQAERAKAYRDRKRGGPPRQPTKQHGTIAAARRHYREGTALCASCRSAWNRYHRETQQRKRDAS